MHWAIKPFAVGLVGIEKCLPFVPIHLFPVARARAWHSSKLCPFLACWTVAFSAITGPEQTASANATTTIRNIGSSVPLQKINLIVSIKFWLGHTKFQVRQPYVYAYAF